MWAVRVWLSDGVSVKVRVRARIRKLGLVYGLGIRIE